jgi:hypothetical protein
MSQNCVSAVAVLRLKTDLFEGISGPKEQLMATVRTVNRLIRSVLSDILGIYNPNQTISAADALTVREAIQDRLAAWAGQITIPVVNSETFAMVPGQASYTIGESGSPSLNTPRPDQIIGAIIREDSVDSGLSIITESQYRGILDKTTPGTPRKIYVSYTTPNITVYLYPVPDATDSIYLSTVKPYTEPTGYTQDTFATLGLPGYVYNTLKWRVAIDVAPGFKADVNQLIISNYNEAEANMMAINLANTMRPVDVELAYSKYNNYGRATVDDDSLLIVSTI